MRQFFPQSTGPCHCLLALRLRLTLYSLLLAAASGASLPSVRHLCCFSAAVTQSLRSWLPHSNNKMAGVTEPVSIRLEIITDNSLNFVPCCSDSVYRITLRNTSNYGLQLKYDSGNLAIAPGALSDMMIFRSVDSGGPVGSKMMARAYVGSLELKKVIDSDGKAVQLFNLDKIVLPNTFHCSLFFIPIC
jgi:hypothetical protein